MHTIFLSNLQRSTDLQVEVENNEDTEDEKEQLRQENSELKVFNV